MNLRDFFDNNGRERPITQEPSPVPVTPLVTSELIESMFNMELNSFQRTALEFINSNRHVSITTGRRAGKTMLASSNPRP